MKKRAKGTRPSSSFTDGAATTRISLPNSSTSAISAAWWRSTCVGTRSEERRVGKECRSRCDWSSDVCSSDLFVFVRGWCCDHSYFAPQFEHFSHKRRVVAVDLRGHEIGRASCRERV